MGLYGLTWLLFLIVLFILFWEVCYIISRNPIAGCGVKDNSYLGEVTFNRPFLYKIPLEILNSIKFTKQQIAEYYGITRKTLNKWFQFIPNSFEFEKIKSARKLTWWDFAIISIEFGRKEDQYPLTKGAIRAMCETRYATMRNCVSLELCGVSKEAYKKIDIFPPTISRSLVQHFGC